MPRALLFDMGGTLLGDEAFDPAAGDLRVLQYAVDTRGLTAEAISAEARALDKQIMPLRDVCGLEFPCRSYQRLLFDRLGIRFTISAEELELEFWRGAVSQTPEPGVVSLLEQLRAIGIRTAVVSNTMFSGSVIESDLADRGLLAYFEIVIASADYGVRKPSPLLLEAALARMGVRPEEAWYAGDRPEFDVAAARAAGMTAVWYNRRGAPAPAGAPAPDLTVRSWDALRGLLNA